MYPMLLHILYILPNIHSSEQIELTHTHDLTQGRYFFSHSPHILTSLGVNDYTDDS